MVWIQLGLAAVLFVVGTLLRKGPDINPAAFEDFGFPDVDPTKRIPIIWGKKRVKSLHTMEVQGYRTKKIKKGNFIKKETVGFKYFATMAMGICLGDGVVVKKIILGDKVVWEGTSTVSDTGFAITVSDGDFHGDDNGIGGTIRIYPGSAAQTVNAVLAAAHATQGGAPEFPDLPYRGVCYAVFEDFYWGNNPQIPQLEIVAQRYPDTLAIGAGRIINTTASESPTEGAVDLAIPEIVNEILSDDTWGLAEGAADIDTVSLTDAATILAAENNAMSFIWNEGDSIRELLQTIMKQADGFVFKRMSIGQWEMNLARDEYLNGSPVNSGLIPIFDETNSTLKRYSRGNWDETFNIIDVNWQDRNIKGRPPTAHVQDMANFSIQGVINPAEFSFPGCHSATLAQHLASRQLKATSFPLATAEITTNRLAFDLVPGDMVEFQWDKLGITRVFMRINAINLGTPGQGEIRLHLVQDVFGVASSIFGIPQNSLAGNQNPDPQQVATALLEDQSRFLASQDTDNPTFAEKPRILATAPQGNALEYVPHAKLASDSVYLEQAVAWGYAASGTLQAALLPADGDVVTLVVENVDDVVDIDAAVTTGEQKTGEGMILIVGTGSPQGGENEILTYGAASFSGSTVTLTNVNRAVEDTVPIRANPGDKVWFISGFVGTTVDVYADTDVIDLKLQNIATTGSADVASATNFGPFTFRRRLDRPFVPGHLEIGSSNHSPLFQRYPSGAEIFQPGALTFRWNRRDKTNPSMYFQTDADDAPLNYVPQIDIYELETTGAPVFVRTLTNDSPADSATYTKAQQYTDGVFNRYQVRLMARDTTESPNLLSLTEVIQKFKRNPLLSPLPSPLSTIPNSPQSPARGSPIASPLSPVPSPLSPVPSPISPVPSPLSPAPLPSPLPSPKTSTTFRKYLITLDPILRYEFDETSGNIINKGRNAPSGNLVPTGGPGTYAVADRTITGNKAFDFSTGAGDFNTSSSENISNSNVGAIIMGIKWNATTLADWIFDFFDGFDFDNIAMRTTSIGGHSSPLDNTILSPTLVEYLNYFLSNGGTSSAFDANFNFPAMPALGDDKFHIVILRKSALNSPNLAELFVDGVQIASVENGAPGASSDVTMWFDNIAGNMQLSLMKRGNPSQNDGDVIMDEFAVLDSELSDFDATCLSTLYLQEITILSPHTSPSSPVPSPLSPVQSPISPVQSPISPVPSPLSPHPSPISPHSPSAQPLEAGYRGFILSEGPTAYWTFGDLEDITISPQEDPINEDAISPIGTEQSLVEEVTGIATQVHGRVATENRSLTRDTYEYSMGVAPDDVALGYIEAVDDAAYDFANTWTISFLMVSGEVFASQNRVIFGRGTTGNSPIASWIEDTDGTIKMLVRDVDAVGSTIVTSTFAVDDGLPHHIMFTQDVGGGDAPVKLYIDGMFNAESAAVGKPFDDGETMHFFSDALAAASHHNGLLAHFAIFNTAKNDIQALEHYQESQRWHPFYAAVQKIAPDHWWRLHDTVLTQDAPIKDWGTLAVDGIALFGPDTVTDGPLAGGQPSRGLRMSDATASPVTGAVGLPDSFTGALSPLLESGAWGCMFRQISGGSPALQTNRTLVLATDGTSTFAVRVNSSNQIYVTLDGGGGNNASFTLDASYWPGDDVWTHLMVVQDGTTTLRVYINGQRVEASDVTVALNGTGASTWWINDITLSATAAIWSLGVTRAATASPVDTNSLWQGDMAEVMFVHNRVPTDAEITAIYAGSQFALDNFERFLAESDPVNLVVTSAVTGATPDEMGNMSDGTATGSIFQTMPMAADDDTLSVGIRRDSTTSYIDFSDSFLKGQTDVTSPIGSMPLKYTALMTVNRIPITGTPTSFPNRLMLIAQNNAGNTALNFHIETQGLNFDYEAFPESGKGLKTINRSWVSGRNTILHVRQNATVRGVIESPSNLEARNIWIAHKESLYQDDLGGASPFMENNPGYVEKYTGGSNTQVRIGEWSNSTGANNRGYGGDVGHVVFWNRALLAAEMQRNAHRFMGYQEQQLMVMQHAPFLYWRLNEPAGSTTIKDWSRNGRDPDAAQLGNIVLDDPENANVWQEDVGFLKTDGGGALVYSNADVPPHATLKTYGGWFQVPTASPLRTCKIALYNSTNTTDYEQLQLFNTGGNYRVQYVATDGTGTQTVTGTTNLTAGVWYHVAVVQISTTEVSLYIDGSLEINSSGLTAITVSPAHNRFAVGTRSAASPIEGNGWYHDVFLIAGTLTENELREIVAKSSAPNYDRVVRSLSPDAYWLLNDGWKVGLEGRFFNQLKNVAGHYNFGTQQIASPELVPGGVAWTPGDGSVDNALDFPAGTGGDSVDTEWIDYANGASPIPYFSVAWWMQHQGTPDGQIADWGGAVANGRPSISWVSNTIRVGIDGSSYRSYTAPTGSVWHHYVATIGATGRVDTIQLFVDGILLTPASTVGGTNVLNIGASPLHGVEFGNDIGLATPLDDVSMSRFSIWNSRVLTVEEARVLYAAGSGTFVESP
jgi:hypothetical protein